MGDQIELTTWPKHLNAFYKITSSALALDIKASGNAAIGLSRKPGGICDYWVIIGDDGMQSWIKKSDNHHRECVNTPEILSMEEYRRFWVTWSSGRLCLGREGSSEPIVSSTNSIHDLHYVTFSVVAQRNPVHWRIEIPPALEKFKYRAITGGELHWVKFKRDLPEDALVGGFENEKLFIARAKHRGSLTPGKYVPSTKKAYISWGCQANEKKDFELLCGFDGVWVPAVEHKIPVGALIGGYSEDNLERLYIGRAEHEGHLIPGKVQPSHKVCYFSYRGKEVGVKKYEILVLPENDRTFNEHHLPERFSELREIEDYYEGDSDVSNDTDEEPVLL